jgi:hypothetical protein
VVNTLRPRERKTRELYKKGAMGGNVSIEEPCSGKSIASNAMFS